MSRKKEPPPQFIAVTADEYELTLGAFDTVKEMCEWSGHKKFAIYQSMYEPCSRRSIVVSIQGRPPRRTAALFLPALPRSIASGM